MLISTLLCIAGELPQDARWRVELESETTPHCDIADDVVAQHGAPPGQGWATRASMVTSTLA